LSCMGTRADSGTELPCTSSSQARRKAALPSAGTTCEAFRTAYFATARGRPTQPCLLDSTVVSNGPKTNESLSPPSVGAILELARRGMRFASDAAVERRDRPEMETERQRRSRVSDIVLTDEERIVLDGKVTGLVEREIAAELHMSVPTVERILRGLRDKLGVATTCALCAKVVSLGLVALNG